MHVVLRLLVDHPAIVMRQDLLVWLEWCVRYPVDSPAIVGVEFAGGGGRAAAPSG